MKYLFNVLDIPPKSKRDLQSEKRKINDMVEGKKGLDLQLLEDEYIDKWNYYKDMIDELDKIRKPHIREDILYARFELTVFDEALRYLHSVSPYNKKSRIPKRELVL